MLPGAVVTAALLNPPLLVKLFSCYPALCSPRCSLELTALYLKAAFVRRRGSLDKLFPSQPLSWPQPVQGCSPPKRGQRAHSVSPLWAAHGKAGTPGLGWGCRTPGGLPSPSPSTLAGSLCAEAATAPPRLVFSRSWRAGAGQRSLAGSLAWLTWRVNPSPPVPLQGRSRKH